MNKKSFQVLAWIGLPLLLLLVMPGFCSTRGLRYRTANYQKSFVWQGIEVGIAYRHPINSVVIRGRHRCVIAFREGKPEQARVLFTTTSGELAPPLDFVSATGAKGTYRTRDGEVVVDAAQWIGKPQLTEDGP